VTFLLNEFKIFFIGVGGTHPTERHSPPSIAVKLDSDFLLMDCGEGCVRGLFHFGISTLKIKYVILTHIHGDHVFGLPSLLHTMALYDRKRDLCIVGPRGTARFIKGLVSAFPYYPSYRILIKEVSNGDSIRLDKYIMLFGPSDHDCEAISVRIEEIAPKYKLDQKKIKALKNLNSVEIKKLSMGEPIHRESSVLYPEEVAKYRIIPRSVVYSGDTRPTEDMIKFSKGARVLIHDSAYSEDLRDVAVEYGHSTAKDAAKIALKAGVDFLFLFHYSPRIKDETILLKEAREIFPRTALSRDLTFFRVPRKYIEIGSERVIYNLPPRRSHL